MRFIKIKGITHIEKFEKSEEWYWGTNYSCGDLYEAEEIFNAGNKFEPNVLRFVHYPDETVYEPIAPAENMYFGRPVYFDGCVYVLTVNFESKNICITRCMQDMQKTEPVAEIPLEEIKDCYNLMIDDSFLMLIRQGHENDFQIIWPKKASFNISERESYCFREGGRLYFSKWTEDPEYREEIIIRKYPTGEIVETVEGILFKMPDGQNWVLQ